MEWIFNPELTEKDIKQIYKDRKKNLNNGLWGRWQYCKATQDSFREKDISILFKNYTEMNTYIDWLKEQKIIIPKETDGIKAREVKIEESTEKGYKYKCIVNKDGEDIEVHFNTFSDKQDAFKKITLYTEKGTPVECEMGYKQVVVTDPKETDKISDDALSVASDEYLKDKIRELEEEVKRLKSEHSDMQNRLEERESIWIKTEREMNESSDRWYKKHMDDQERLDDLHNTIRCVQDIINGAMNLLEIKK